VSPERVGLLGGTFDPIHVGHLGAAEAAIGCAKLDRVVFIPAATPPHRAPAVAAAVERLEMCRLATEGDARFGVSDMELKREGPSYTVDTLGELRRMHPSDELFLILGWDAARLFPTWRRPDEVRELASVVVVGRTGSQAPREADLNEASLGGRGVVLCLEPTPDVSASEIRRAVALGESIAGKVPAAVERYITAHRLYAG
jgi:nicotinate-nucleotide adenylyltransferase